MNRISVIAALCVMFLVCAAPAVAQAADATDESGAAAKLGPESFSVYLGAAFGCGLIIIGAAYGIGKIGAAAVESMARQPEVAGSIGTSMLIAAALIEGVTFFGLIVCLLTLFF